MNKATLLFFCLMVLAFFGCQETSSRSSNVIATDSVTITRGQHLFTQNCSSCHGFRVNGIGPALGGVTKKRTYDWLKRFIKDPAAMIASGDTNAVRLYDDFRKTTMPSFKSLGDEDIAAVIAFINTKKAKKQSPTSLGTPIKDPIPERILPGGLTIELTPFTIIPPSDKTAPAARITKLIHQPVTNELFVLDLRGKLYKLKKEKPTVFLDIHQFFPKFMEKPGLATGFGSFAFHPDFKKNGIFYTSHAEFPNSGKADFSYEDSIKVTLQWVVTEWKMSNINADNFSGTHRELMRVNMVSNMHGMQELTFNPYAQPGSNDYGLLYIGIGDGGCVESGYPFVSHDLHRVWGTILRIDPFGHNSTNKNYGIPKDNPFLYSKDSGICQEIYAYGFRNPHRITWTQSGKMLASNVGQTNIESLNLIEPGKDYGWPLREGKFVLDYAGDMDAIFAAPSPDTLKNFLPPVAAYDHDEGNAISGGYEYTGKSIPALKGKFIFGDIPSGRLFYVNINELEQGNFATIHSLDVSISQKPANLKQVCHNGRVDLHFGRDANGELYVLTKEDGQVYKIVGAGVQ